MNNVLTIANVSIRQDEEGRYCLNDLHKAAGGADKHRPSFFTRRKETTELVSILLNRADSHSFTYPLHRTDGRNGGTYACKAVVYEYAAWISAEFRLKVYEAYDNLQTQGVAVAEHAAEDVLANPLKYMRTVLEQAEQLQAMNAELTRENKVQGRVLAATNHALSRVVKMYEGVNNNKIKESLLNNGIMYRKAGTYRVYAKYADYFVEKINPQYGSMDITVTGKGKTLLSELYEAGALIMRKGFTPQTQSTYP